MTEANINLQHFWESYLSQTEVNHIALTQNKNIDGPNFNDSRHQMEISQEYPEHGKKFNAKINSDNKQIEMSISNINGSDKNVVVQGEIENAVIKADLDIINESGTDISGNSIVIQITSITPQKIEYELIREPEQINSEVVLRVIRFLLDKEIEFMRTDMRKLIKPKDIYFISLTKTIKGSTPSMPTDFPHMDLCSFNENLTDINKFCGISSILYTDIYKRKTPEEPKEETIYPSAFFFFGPEIPSQTNDIQFKQKTKKLDNPYDSIDRDSLSTNYWDLGISNDHLNEIFNDMVFEYPPNKENFNKKYEDLFLELLNNPNRTNPGTDEEKMLSYLKTYYDLSGQESQNLLEKFQNKYGRIFVSAPMKTSGWAVWKNQPSRIKKIDWNNIECELNKGNESSVTFDDAGILAERKKPGQKIYYTHISRSKDSVWHASPHLAYYNPSDEFTQPANRDFITFRFSNFNIYSSIRFILIPKNKINQSFEQTKEKIYKNIVISNIQNLCLVFITLKNSFKTIQTENFLKVVRALGVFLVNIGIDSERIKSIGIENIKRDDIQVNNLFDNIKLKTEIQCKAYNDYKQFNNYDIVNGLNRTEYTDGFHMLSAYLEKINGYFAEEGISCVLETDTNSDVKLEDYYYKKYLKYKAKYLELKK